MRVNARERMQRRANERGDDNGKKKEEEETEKKCLYASKLLFSVFNAFHASTGSVNYRFEGTADDATLRHKTKSNITHGSLSKTANHRGYGNIRRLSITGYQFLSNSMRKRQKDTRSNEDDLSIVTSGFSSLYALF